MRALLAAALLLASGAACALGLGEIRVLSRPGQPLLAEIPVVSSDPGELEQLRAGLAAPVVFERVGLPRPQGLVEHLDFAVALSDEGKPVIRVTSRDPVDTPSVNFLVEVNWGQGRLVREYSALIGAPGAVAAAQAPAVAAPVAAPDSTIQPAPAPLPAQPLAATQDTPAAPSPEASTAVAPVPASQPVAPRAPIRRPAPQAKAEGGLTVQRGDTLSGLARALVPGASLDQAMIALLQANPEAFIGGNINRLRAGAVLRAPAEGQAQALAAAEASAMVRRQVAEWRQARAPMLQPAGAAAATPAGAAAHAPVAADARLEIAPPAAAAAQRAGTTSGIQAAGEGDILANQQLTQATEDLAARQAEVQELKSRVAELEKLQGEQAKLIAMKDSDLAAAQARLGKDQAGGGVPGWAWFGLAVVLVGLVGFALLRRRAPAPSAAARRFDAAAAASAVAAAGRPEAAPAPVQTGHGYVPSYLAEEAPAPAGPMDLSPQPESSRPIPPWTAPTARPTWHTGSAGQTLATATAGPVPPPVQAPEPAIVPAAGGRERLELALAYLDLGDTAAARPLLEQVAAGEDLAAGAQARRLLDQLG